LLRLAQATEQVTVTPLGDPLPWNPNVVDCPAPSEPLYAAFVATTVPVLPLVVAFQALVSEVPLGRLMLTRQPDRAWFAVTVTLPTKPPGHGFGAEKAAEQPVPLPEPPVVVLVLRLVVDVVVDVVARLVVVVVRVVVVDVLLPPP
jgi:hypothetical protein